MPPLDTNIEISYQFLIKFHTFVRALHKPVINRKFKYFFTHRKENTYWRTCTEELSSCHFKLNICATI